MKIFILKEGTITGPFDEQEILDKVDSGGLSEDDMAMTEGLEAWTPLKAIIVKEPELSPLRARANHLAGGVETAAERVRLIYTNHPVAAGIVALLFGCVLMVLSQWPVLIYGPFLVAAIVPGLLLLRWQRLVAGILILSLTIILPLTIRQMAFYRQMGFYSDKLTVNYTAPSPVPIMTVQSITPSPTPGLIA